MPVLLSDLLGAIPEPVLGNIPLDVWIHGVTQDSRQVQPGWLFVARSGGQADGHRFIPDAIQRGAAAILGSQNLAGLETPYFQVRDSSQALAYLAAAFYAFPAHQMMMIGVTGTDGKTTTANLIYHILQRAGLRAGMISTINARIGDQALDTGFHVTTPDAPDIQRYLAMMVSAGLTHAILEATSHGLAQGRVAACAFDAAVVTNITHEHLDYHGSYEAYRAAKGILFASLNATPAKACRPPRGAVLNRDDSSYAYLAGITRVLQVSYGFEGADVCAEEVRPVSRGMSFTIVGTDREGRAYRLPVKSPLVGDYNVANSLAAAALAIHVIGLPLEAVRQGLESLREIPGRMQPIDMGQNFLAMVDFAHTPNALHRALQAGRRLTSGRVIAVFGSAGLRDRQKRRMMAETSAELADLTVLTAEDPRTESLPAILAEMAAGARSRGAIEGKTFWRIPDRREALRHAVRLARPGDLVIACGKGHEQTMCFGEIEYPWDDRVAMQAALAELLGIDGPEMPFLPAVDGET